MNGVTFMICETVYFILKFPIDKFMLFLGRMVRVGDIRRRVSCYANQTEFEA
jgi:hypothetical protein